ncbi:hypothetical protein [Halorubrum sp. CSM-61]|uniref:hypothetical protein n=1 Tax=Halorubrum sp. CSM-61 TaxID=2485838 RepID=UPI000F4C3D8E|nr:hypothetical protein [Halorubrum sp. CSM-61]
MHKYNRSPPPDDENTVTIENHYQHDSDRLLCPADQRRIEAFNEYDTEHEPLEYPSAIPARRLHNRESLSPLAVYHLMQLETATRRKTRDVRGELYTVEDLRVLCEGRLSEHQLRDRLWQLRHTGLLTNEGSAQYLQLMMPHRELGSVFTEHVDNRSATTVQKFKQSTRGLWRRLPLAWPTDGFRGVTRQLFRNEILTGSLCLIVFALGTLTILAQLFEGHPVDDGMLLRAYWLTWAGVTGFTAVSVGLTRRLIPLRGHRLRCW